MGAGDTVWRNYKEHLLFQNKDFYRSSSGTKNLRTKLIDFHANQVSEISKAVSQIITVSEICT